MSDRTAEEDDLQSANVSYAHATKECPLKRGNALFDWAAAKANTLPKRMGGRPTKEGSIVSNRAQVSILNTDEWPDWELPVPNYLLSHGGKLRGRDGGGSNDVERAALYRASVGFWKPHITHSGCGPETCIECGSTTGVVHDGWLPRLRRVAGLDGTRKFLMVGQMKHQGCPKASKGKASTCWDCLHPKYLSTLPRHVRMDLENRFHIRQNGGIATREAVNLLDRLIAETGNFSDFEASVKEIVMLGFEDARLLYLERLKFKKDEDQTRIADKERTMSQGLARFLRPQEGQDQQTEGDAQYSTKSHLASFGNFNSKNGYAGWIPSDNFWSSVFMSANPEEDAEIRRAMASVDGEWLALDDTFESMTFGRGPDGNKIFHACKDAMNEYGQIWGLWFSPTKDLQELSDAFKEASKRAERLKFEPVKYLTVDDLQGETVEAQKRYWESTIETLLGLYMDGFHMLGRYETTLQQGHPLKGRFLKMLSQCIYQRVVDGDTCFRSAEEMTELADQLIAVFSGDIGHDGTSGLHVFGDTMQCHERNRKLFADGYVQVPAGVAASIDITKPGSKKKKYRKKAGSSALEGFHRHLNKILRAIGTMGIPLLHKVVMTFVHRWNVKAGIKNRGDADFGHFSIVKKRRLHQLASELGLLHTIPANLNLTSQDWEVTEQFGAMWCPGWAKNDTHSSDENADDDDEDAHIGDLQKLVSDALESGSDILAHVLTTATATATTMATKVSTSDENHPHTSKSCMQKDTGSGSVPATLLWKQLRPPNATNSGKALFEKLLPAHTNDDGITNYRNMYKAFTTHAQYYDTSATSMEEFQCRIYHTSAKLLKQYGDRYAAEELFNANVAGLPMAQQRQHQQLQRRLAHQDVLPVRRSSQMRQNPAQVRSCVDDDVLPAPTEELPPSPITSPIFGNAPSSTLDGQSELSSPKDAVDQSATEATQAPIKNLAQTATEASTKVFAEAQASSEVFAKAGTLGPPWSEKSQPRNSTSAATTLEPTSSTHLQQNYRTAYTMEPYGGTSLLPSSYFARQIIQPPMASTYSLNDQVPTAQALWSIPNNFGWNMYTHVASSSSAPSLPSNHANLHQNQEQSRNTPSLSSSIPRVRGGRGRPQRCRECSKALGRDVMQLDVHGHLETCRFAKRARR